LLDRAAAGEIEHVRLTVFRNKGGGDLKTIFDESVDN
jgi:hypothetical protein